MTTKAILLGVVLAGSSLAQSQDHFYELYNDDSGLLSVLSPPGAGYDVGNGNLYTANGTAVTFTRASTWTCTDSNGAVRSLASGKPCLVDNASLRVRSPVVRLNSHPSELDNAAWIKGSVTVTANTHSSPDGTMTADTVVYSAASFPSVSQEFTANGGAYTISSWMRAVSGTVTNATVAIFDTIAATDKCTSGAVTLTTEWQRVTCTAATTVSGNVHRARVFRGNGASVSGSVVVWHGQLVAGTQPGDACDVAPTLTSQTCAAETATVATPATLSPTEGCVCASITPSWTGANPFGVSTVFLSGSHGSSFTREFMYTVNTGNSVRATDGTNIPQVGANHTTGVRKRFCTRWSVAQNLLKVENITEGTSASSVFAGFAAFTSDLGIGQRSSSSHANANLDSIVFGKSFGACQ